MNELTYILGAGASFESMPVVATFAERFSEFETAIINKVTLTRQYAYDNDLLNFRLRIRSLGEQFHTHQSFDTYFKKLFHISTQEEIRIAKKILNLYFTWEHLNDKDGQKNKGLFQKKATVDKRYDALIAGLLRPIKNKRETYCKINFITWNYDLNLFYSLKNYFSPATTTDDFFTEIKVDDFEWNIQNQISIFNINGYYYNTVLKDMRRLIPTESENLKIEMVKGGFLKDDNDDLIKFAWENDNTTFLSKINHAISKSKHIVIIGYTFPLYNRMLDYSYFKDETLQNKTLYIQNPDADTISEDLKDNFYLKSNGLKIKILKNCSSFFVPSNIINEEPIQKTSIYSADNM